MEDCNGKNIKVGDRVTVFESERMPQFIGYVRDIAESKQIKNDTIARIDDGLQGDANMKTNKWRHAVWVNGQRISLVD